MKKFLLYIPVLFLFLQVIVFSQENLVENFPYQTGSLTLNSANNWIVTSPTFGYPIQVIEGNLIHDGYSPSGIGNLIFLDAGSSARSGVKRAISSVTNSIYVSFLAHIQDTLDLAANSGTGGCFLSILDSYDASKSNIYIKKSIIPGCVNIGLSKGSVAVYSNIDHDIKDTHLFVVKYTMSNGPSNDTTCLWINPDTKIEPLPDVKINSGTDLFNFTAINLKQGALSGNLYIDAIKVWTKWGDTPLPVELTSFTAAFINNKVTLNWKTETEVENYGFKIERKINDKNAEWKELAFIPGNGNSNSPKYYSYNDNSVKNLMEYCYRLKQIDNGGTFKYSDEVTVDVNIPEDFQLYQNYPNPFNPITSIKFFLPEAALTKLAIYNVIGEKTADLLQEFLTAGEHVFNIDGSNLNSGVYLCTLESGGRKKTIKITLIK